MLVRAIGLGLAMTIALSSVVLAALNFKLPFVCGETYRGSTYDGHGYGAIDFNKDDGSDVDDPVLASAGGTVVERVDSNGRVRINHQDGASVYQTVYAHMKNISVSVNDTVQLGQQIGTVWNTGAVGYHLHYNQLLNGSEQLAKFDGVTYQYNTLITSTNCSGEPAAPAMLYDLGPSSARIYRWSNGGGTFNGLVTADTSNFYTGYVSDRFVSGDFDNDGHEDVLVAYSNAGGTFSFKVASHAAAMFTTWYTSDGSWSIASVQNRLVAGDWNADGKTDVAMARDNNNTTVSLYRWHSTGTGFNASSPINLGSFNVGNVGDRMVAADWNGDGGDDVIMAYQKANGTFSYHVWLSAYSYVGAVYTSGQFTLSRVAGRLAAGDWNADGKGDAAMAYDNNNGTFGLYRWTSTGSGFTFSALWTSGSFALANVGDRMTGGRFTSDATDDIVIAYQNANGTFSYYVWQAASSYSGIWYTSGQFSISAVDGRLVAGAW